MKIAQGQTQGLFRCCRAGFAVVLTSLVYLLAVSAHAQQLVHRYSFTADASDSVGGADGTLVGTAIVSNGAVVLDGVVGDYVNLPANLVTNLTNYSFEIWLTWNGGPAWQRIFDFGNSTAGQGVQSSATESACLTPDDGSQMGSFLYPTNGGFNAIDTTTPLTVGFLHQIVWTYDNPSTTAKLYVDSVQVDENTNQTVTLADVGPTENDWIGQSQFFGDPEYFGSITEFRIYNGALSSGMVTSNYLNGPDNSGWGPIQDLRLLANSPMRVGTGQQVQVVGDFLNVSNLLVTTDTNTTYRVSDASVLAVTTNGFLSSVGLSNGMANVIATYAGVSVTQAIQVLSYPTPVMVHRYSFTADASDSVGTANGTLMGDAAISDGQVVLDGNAFVQLPGDFCDSLTNLSFEFWLTWNGGAEWQHIFDFGNNDGANGNGFGNAFHDINLVAKDGDAATDGGAKFALIVINGDGVQSQIGVKPLSVGNNHHVVWTYDQLSTTARLYVDGLQVGVQSNMTASINGFSDSPNCWLGQSQYGPMQDPDFSGSIDEFRIYNAALSASQVATNFLDGPSGTGRGSLVDVRVIGSSPMLPGISQQLQVLADYSLVTGVDVTGDPGVTYQVSDPTVLAVTTNGLLTGLGAVSNSASVTASFLGVSGYLNVQVSPPAPAVLIHRYSFTTDASDSVGTANGVLMQDAVVSNGTVVLDGNAFVQLPANFVTNLTDLTFEFWLTWNGGGEWQHIFDFGDNDGANGSGFGNALHDINLVAEDGNAATDGGGNLALIVINDFPVVSEVGIPPLTVKKEHQLVWTYDTYTTTAALYVDGALMGTQFDMTNTFAGNSDAPNCWLGQSQYGPNQDPDFNGSIDEFRIYDSSLTPQEVAAHFSAGPNVLVSPLQLSSALTNGQITISWPVAGSTGFSLQTSPVLGSAASWVAAGGNTTVVNGQNQFTIQATNKASFYRLVK